MNKIFRMFGRREICTDETTIHIGNVLDVLGQAMVAHSANSREIDYLYRYLKGDQPILGRRKTEDVRSDINNITEENRAFEVHSFWKGFVGGKPVQYVSRDTEAFTEKLKTFNDYLYAVKKTATDKKLFSWLLLDGVAYRAVLPNTNPVTQKKKPALTYAPDPRCTFVIHSGAMGNEPLAGVHYVKRQSGQTVFSVYTDRQYFEIVDGKITAFGAHTLGMIPIIEYRLNEFMLGIFEPVLPILDAINSVASNRQDAIDQFIQAFLVFQNVDFEKDDVTRLRKEGAIGLPKDADVKYLVSQLNQMDTQTLVDHMYQTVLTICSMPNRNGGSSTSDTGTAVIFRDGWSTAESRAQDIETGFKESELDALQLFLYICDTYCGLGLEPEQVDIRFTRRNDVNIQAKVNVLLQLLSNDNVHPEDAFVLSDLFADPGSAFQKGQKWKAEQEKKDLNAMRDMLKKAKDTTDDQAKEAPETEEDADDV